MHAVLQPCALVGGAALIDYRGCGLIGGRGGSNEPNEPPLDPQLHRRKLTNVSLVPRLS